MTTFTLEAPGLDALTLDPDDGWKVRLFDFASGSLRPSVIDAPSADGTIDTSTLRGAGSVTIGLRLVPGTETTTRKIARLKSFTHGRLRPTLTIDYDDGTDPVFAVLSQGAVLAPLQEPTHRDASAVWKVPAGITESVDLHAAIAMASGSAGALGRTYDLEFDRTYPATDPEGSVLVTNVGSADAYPLIRLYGPMSDELRIVNDLTGLEIIIDGETIAAGAFLELDTRARTVLLNGDPTQTRYHRVIFPGTTWFTLVPGEQRIRLVAETFTSPAQAEILWRDSYA